MPYAGEGSGVLIGAVAVVVLLSMMSAADAAEPGKCGFSEGDPAAGKTIYRRTCVGCHGANGKGVIPGTPNFNKHGGVLSKPHSALTDHIKNGFRSSGKPMPMPPKGGNPRLTDKDIRDVHAYLHQHFGCG